MLLTGLYKGISLIVVITQIDRVIESAGYFDTDEEITVEQVKKQTCQFLREVCPTVVISHDDVLVVSGRWAYLARMLANTYPHESTHSSCRLAVIRCLNSARNIDESPNMSLNLLPDNELSAKLEAASGIAALEQRYPMFMLSILHYYMASQGPRQQGCSN